MTMASRIVVMKLGRIQQIGSPIEIYNHPANLFVAGFIGSPAMNFFKARFDSKKGIIKFNNDSELEMLAEIIKDKAIPEQVIFGIRPEDIKLAEGEILAKYPKAIFELKVSVAELLGNEYYVHSEFGGSELVCKIPAINPIKIGDKIKVCVDLGKVHFFDPKTEKAL